MPTSTREQVKIDAEGVTVDGAHGPRRLAWRDLAVVRVAAVAPPSGRVLDVVFVLVDRHGRLLQISCGASGLLTCLLGLHGFDSAAVAEVLDADAPTALTCWAASWSTDRAPHAH